jgi:glycosyltransferase involved in cell wall biosynthesis
LAVASSCLVVLTALHSYRGPMLPIANPNLLMGFYFFPRGGSAQVARYLCRALVGCRWEPTLFTGSMGAIAQSSNAHRFFSGIRCQSLDYSSALAHWRAGGDAMAAAVPMHASYEDKTGVPDRIFFDLDNAAFDRQVRCWKQFLANNATAEPTVVHLHHLTPIHEAVRELWPNVPVITHLHGTELKMLAAAQDEATGASSMWTHEWVDRMRRWAGQSDRVVVVAEHDKQLAQQILHLDPTRIATIASGVDTDVFSPRERTHDQRLALWRRCLVDEPRGWRPGEPVGSIRYQHDDLAAFTDHNGQSVPVVLFAGRFLRFKRLQLLIEAHHAMRVTTSCRSVLVIVGGFPCEWEGEHPYDTVQRLGADDVFFVGWRDHDDLSEILNCSDVFAAPSVEEPFGLVYLEAMATGVPPVATNTGGPLSFINVDPDDPTGWLVPPDDVVATTRALVEAVSDRATRIDRGRRSARFIREHYSWASSADAFGRLYDEVAAEAGLSTRSQARGSISGVA